MLFLRAADGSAEGEPVKVPVAAAAGLHLERALLADDDSARIAELNRALESDANLAAWALGRAETGLGRTVNRIDEAAEWLARDLVAELSTAIIVEAESPADSIEWRLPLLVKKLAESERGQIEFDRRLEREKLDAMKELAYGASHEINNPLANIAARAQTLLDGEEDPERRNRLVSIHRQAMRAHEMISDLMLFARPPKLRLATFDLRQLLRNVTEGLAEFAAETNVHVGYATADRPFEIVADETQLGVAVHAVVKNAIEAVGDGGHIEVELRQINVQGNALAEILVRDDGPGISGEVQRHLFDPFFSGREAGRGLGFGLSKCWRIVTNHGGQIVVHRSATGGAEFSILLPFSQKLPSQSEPTQELHGR
jgi:signal transduction histidine kinase